MSLKKKSIQLKSQNALKALRMQKRRGSGGFSTIDAANTGGKKGKKTGTSSKRAPTESNSTAKAVRESSRQESHTDRMDKALTDLKSHRSALQTGVIDELASNNDSGTSQNLQKDDGSADDAESFLLDENTGRVTQTQRQSVDDTPLYDSKHLPMLDGQKEQLSSKKRDAFFNLEYLFFESDSEMNDEVKNNSFILNTSGSILNRSASYNDVKMTSADKSAIKNYTFWNNKQKSVQSKQTAARILAKIARNTTIRPKMTAFKASNLK